MTKDKKKQTSVLLIIALTASIVVGAVIAWQINETDETVSNTAVDASSASENRNVSRTPADEIEESTSTINLEEAALEPKEGFTGDGVATRNFENGVFVHTVSAAIDDPAEGTFYEGWLVKDGGFISTGKLEKANDVFELRFESETDYTNYPRVVITQETESLGLDNNPEVHVLEGSF